MHVSVAQLPLTTLLLGCCLSAADSAAAVAVPVAAVAGEIESERSKEME